MILSKLASLHQRSFDCLGIHSHLVEAIAQKFKISNPTPAQQKFIPVLLSGSSAFIRDVTGSGKTLGLLLGILSLRLPKMKSSLGSFTPSILPNGNHQGKTDVLKKNYTSTLILVPSRDLALQMTEWIRLLNPHLNQERMNRLVQCVVSGIDIQMQSTLLEQSPPSILIGTPKRTLELYESNAFNATRLQLIFADEIDRLVNAVDKSTSISKQIVYLKHPLPSEILLDKIFKERKQGRFLHSKLKSPDPSILNPLQFIGCSATLSSNTMESIKERGWTKDAVLVDASGSLQLPTTLQHYAYTVGKDALEPIDWNEQQVTIQEEYIDSQKDSSVDEYVLKQMIQFIKREGIESGIILCQPSVSMKRIVENCKKLGLESIGSTMDFIDYTQSCIHFESRKFPKWVVLTEPEARGFDLPFASHIFLLGLPSSPASYLQSSGRVGRAGRKGIIITLLRNKSLAKPFLSVMKFLGISNSLMK